MVDLTPLQHCTWQANRNKTIILDLDETLVHTYSFGGHDTKDRLKQFNPNIEIYDSADALPWAMSWVLCAHILGPLSNSAPCILRML